VRLLPGASQAAPVNGEPIALDWFNGTLWSGGQTPTELDDVVIEGFPCARLSPGYLHVTGSAAVARSLSFVPPVTARRGAPASPSQCNTVLLVADGAKLTIQGSVSLSYDWAFVALGTSAVLQVAGNMTVTAGVLQGFGLVSASTFSASGLTSHVAPGRDVFATCGLCMPGWAHTNDPDVTGTLTFNVSLVTVGEFAVIWIKHDIDNLAPADNVVITGVLALNNGRIVQMPPSDTPPEPTIFFAALANGSMWDVDTNIKYPWIGCTCPACNPSLDICVSGTPVGVPPPPVCKALSPGSILTGLGDCSAPRSPTTAPGSTSCATMSPPCVHGDCDEKTVTCKCPSDGRGFGFNGDVCDKLYCAAGCGGAAQGMCTLTGTDVLPHCECNSAWQGESCQQPRCVPPCTVNGTCAAAGGGQSVCNCAPGWQGATCATPLAAGTCPDCGGRGSCSAATNFSCNCTEGYSGSSCGIATCPGPSCNGNGVCRPAFPPVCDCAPQWSGPTCSTRQCVSSDCLNGAACTLFANQPVCSCTLGWGGSRCQLVSFSANATVTTTPAADSNSIVGLAVGVALGVAAAGVVVGLTVYFVHRYRMASETLSMNKELAQKGLVELERQKATGSA
jgi:hypothetical protein